MKNDEINQHTHLADSEIEFPPTLFALEAIHCR